ncbi:BTB and MATH domain-containing protein 38-like [Ruditapes philippinarum]|uniref:BTB and MATH domain-containing protein 38-like n=1 Tax=Ruditapes philippinarum TaxID=129788 RepID=UPI00295C0FAE|nr:BTB and MATH domain-containing protein 38-like [Ruditapes philippinarum]XP_060586339.1 BTB and MATH domain-containing protein 38-like [Ruditapes philippinarum]
MSQEKKIGSSSSEKEELKDKQTLINKEFCEENGIADLTLIVENHKIPLCKSVLCIASPVFRTMLEGHFREKTETEIPLPGKRYDDFVEFLRCIYPDKMQKVTERNVYMLLPLAHEYDVRNMMKRCQTILVKTVEKMHIRDVKQLYRHIHLSEMYNLEELKERCIYLASENTLQQFKASRTIYQISDASHYKIIELALRRHELDKADEKDFYVKTNISHIFSREEVSFNLHGSFYMDSKNETDYLKSLRIGERYGLETGDKIISSILRQKARDIYFDNIEEFDLLPEKIKSALQKKN